VAQAHAQAKKNLIIQHMGMGWPVGTVVPPEAFPGGHAGHVALGAVKETDYPVSADVGPLPESLKPGDDPVKANDALRAEVAALSGQLAGVRAELAAARKAADDAKAEAAALTAEAEQMMQAADAKLAAAQQLTLNAGPAPAPK